MSKKQTCLPRSLRIDAYPKTIPSRKFAPFAAFTILALFLSACLPQANAGSSALQPTPVIQSSIEIRTFTPTPSPSGAPVKISGNAGQTANGVQEVYALV